jgi:LuxR family maltose regulon positive regulatory protein
LSLYTLHGESASTEFYTRIIDDPLENVLVRARALVSMCHMYAIACRPVYQERTARVLLRLCEEHGLVVSAAEAHRQLGSSHYERNDLEMAVQYYSLAVEQRYLLNFATARDSFVGLALAYQAQGRAGEAEAVANSLEEFYLDRGLANLAEFDSSQARLAFLRGDADRALSTLERSGGANRPQIMTAFETTAVTRTMIHLLAGNAEQRNAAVALLPGLQRSAEASRATWHLIRILQIQAIALQREGRMEEALKAMQRAIMLGYPDRIVGSIIELGAPIEPLLRQLAERGVEPAYIGELLAALQPQLTSQQPGPMAASAVLVEPLSTREMEVLLLLNRRLSNKEVAARLVISPLTVKRHVTNILQKLGVDSRWDAVERARAIGLIAPG